MSKPSVVFSPEEHSRIVEMVNQGLTIQSIAYSTGHSSRSVQDHLKEHRIKTAHTKLREKKKQERAEKEAQAKGDKKPKIRDRNIKFNPEPPREISDPTPLDFKMRLVTLEEKKPYDCSWIIGDPKKNYRYCGNSTIGSGSLVYCKFHAGVSRSKPFQPSIRPYAPINQK